MAAVVAGIRPGGPLAMTAGRLVYVTGTPGTGVEKSLLKFIEWRLGRGEVTQDRCPIVLKLEDELRARATEDVRQSLGILVATGAHARLFDVLLLPKSVLSARWRESFDHCLSTAREHVRVGKDVLLTFHACWYHLGNKEYISGIDFGRLNETDAHAPLVVTLIDDIFDVRSRLSVPGGLLDSQLSSDSDLLDVVLKLMLILDWRAFEITLSERVAHAVRAKHFLFAVKHPLRTLGALLQEGRRSIYLSHHISELRRMLYRSDSDRRTADSMIRSIQAVARELRATTVLFEPTTIDEARFDHKVRVRERELVVPMLGRRWPLASEDETELAWVRPAVELPELGHEWGEKASRIVSRGLGRKPKPKEIAELEAASALIGTLRDKIVSQINSRDHFLVEHCDGIAVYRPFLRGHEAGGVKEEIVHHQRLIRAGIGRATAVLLHPPEDEQIRPRRMARRCLEGWRKQGEILGKATEFDRMLREIPSSEGFWTAIRNDDALATGRRLKEHLSKYGLRFRSAGTSGALDSAPAHAEQEADERRGASFSEWMNKSYLKELEQGPRTVVLNEELSPEEFASRVELELDRT